jgi:TRAP-type mannitol/chloroaromatic compound transport system permease small subunit
MPMAVAIFSISWPYVMKSWKVLETSQEGSGLPAVFLLKTVILLYAALVALQGVSLALRSLMTISGVAPPPRPADVAAAEAASGVEHV